MKATLTMLRVVLATTMCAGLGGCIVHTHPAHESRGSTVVVRCHPSEYWDGRECRHKGHAYGHDKHDHGHDHDD
jgi:hypothetical protein